MTRIKILGLAIGASLLLAYQPIANATPLAAPLIKAEASTGNFVVQARIHHGVAIRTTRRHVRRGAYYGAAAGAAAYGVYGRPACGYYPYPRCY
jgi:hypothetical protein